MSPLIPGVPEEFPELAPPQDVTQMVGENLFSLYRGAGRDPALALFEGPPPESAGISKAYELYETGLESSGRHVLAKSHFRGWYYVLFDGQNSLGHLEVSFQPGTPYRLRRIGGGGKGLESVMDECRFLESLQLVKDEDWILRYLRVWSLSIFAYWITSTQGSKRNFVVPLAPTAADLRPAPNTLYEGEHFAARVREIAQARLDSGLNVIDEG